MLNRRPRLFLFFFLAFQVQAAALYSPEKLKELAFSPTWLKLLHYKKTWGGTYKSLADGKNFFLHPSGKTDPYLELQKNVELFTADSGTGQLNDSDPRCLFPARLRFLQEALQLPAFEYSEQACAGFHNYRKNLSATSVTLVFSSYYLNNPSSGFGHVFLRVNKESAKERRRSELLDHGVNFAATVDTGNALVYAVKGIFGFFKGEYTALPYYYKVREYNDYESRDLWEYELNLDQAEIDRFVAHLWEMGSNHFDYYYFDENCAYHILSLLEASAPRFDLTSRLSWAVVPADALKVIYSSPGLVKSFRRRPSLRNQLNARLSSLNAQERKSLQALLRERSLDSLTQVAGDDSQAKILDAGLDVIDLKYNSDLVYREGDAGKWKQKLLQARARNPIRSKEITVKSESYEEPHQAYPSSRVGLMGGFRHERGSTLNLSYRGVLRDLVDPALGLPRGSHIEMLNLRLDYAFSKKRFYLQDLTLFQVTSLSPLTEYDSPLSWHFKVAGLEARDKDCQKYCFQVYGDLGGGFSFQLLDESLLFFTTGDLELTYSKKFSKQDARLGMGPAAGFQIMWSPEILSLVRLRYRYRFFTAYPHYYQLSAEHRWAFKKRYALSFESSGGTSGLNALGGFHVYF